MRSDVLSPISIEINEKNGLSYESWIDRFRLFGLSNLTQTAKKIVEEDSKFIVNNCILSPDVCNAWNNNRVRSGIVVGAVQSGKTTSMLAVTANLLDLRTDIIIILAGTRVALWQQTFERLLTQLDGTTIGAGRNRRNLRQFIPKPESVLGTERLSPIEYTKAAKLQLNQSLKKNRPIIIVIPKQDDHLIAVAQTLQSALIELPDTPNIPLIHMVVLDDEADDGSVLDTEQAKIIPARVQMLWTGRGISRSETGHPRLYATYVAYTATPQANFLQIDSNPLSPRDFCVALRVPAKSGGAQFDTRNHTYTEPLGIKSHYFGGEAWYISSPRLSTEVQFPDRIAFDSDHEHENAVDLCTNTMTDNAVRAFLVASALRDLIEEEKGKLSICEIAARELLSEVDINRLPPPCGMLIHPASSVDRHWQEARRLIAQANGESINAFTNVVDLTITGQGWIADLDTNPAIWHHWYQEYKTTQTDLEDYPGGAELSSLTCIEWDIVIKRLRSLMPLVKLRVINSDPSADDRPRYKSIKLSIDKWQIPPDLLTIFVSGNVMSRGITLEGLTTSVFSRSSKTPVADTQMQMQRWFGYRGSIAPMLRLFTFKDQRELFEAYHGYDIAMRREICAAMNDGTFVNPQVILQGSKALATAKVPTNRLPLSPGATPSVRLIELSDEALRRANLAQVEHALQNYEWSPIIVNGEEKGLLMDAPWTLQQAAEFLDALRFSHHDPQINGDPRYARWAAIETQLDLADDEGPLLRTPNIQPQPGMLNIRSCPYNIAAYLRLWAASLRRNRIDGMSATHRPDTSWSLVRASLPKDVPVRVGLRFGSLPVLIDGFLGERRVRPVLRSANKISPNYILNTLWGSRGTTGDYLGDQRFDYHRIGAPFPPDLHSGGAFWRPKNHDALLLIHIVQPKVDDDLLKLSVTVGLSLPEGGPEQFAATLAFKN
ncbi:Z1 domain-containing protein [Myxococcota bacterium]|nr:Z1 domain-containing protein [Myxococcota bacterium]MBU1430287.1 Z1 domain-containing protein [Myxococcota bacterium]